MASAPSFGKLCLAKGIQSVKKNMKTQDGCKKCTTQNEKSVPTCIQCNWRCVQRHDIEFNAAMLQKQGCSFQTK